MSILTPMLLAAGLLLPVAIGVSCALFWIFKGTNLRAGDRMLAILASGAVPIVALIGSVLDVFNGPQLGGPAATASILMWGSTAVLLVAAWPAGYWVNLQIAKNSK